MNKTLKIDNLRESGMELLGKYSELLHDDHLVSYKGLLETEKHLSIDDETFENDVAYYLNLIIEILTTYEEQMSDDDKDEFETICTLCLDINELDNYHIGKLIIYNNLPYKIYDIDYNDVSLLIGSNDEEEFWLEIKDLK